MNESKLPVPAAEVAGQLKTPEDLSKLTQILTILKDHPPVSVWGS